MSHFSVSRPSPAFVTAVIATCRSRVDLIPSAGAGRHGSVAGAVICVLAAVLVHAPAAPAQIICSGSDVIRGVLSTCPTQSPGSAVRSPAPGSLGPKSIPQTGLQPTFDDQLAQLNKAVPTFGGLFVDEEADTLFIYLTRSSPAALQSVARRLRVLFDIPERRTRMLRARYDWRQLKTWHDRITSGVFSVSGVTMSDIDDRRNRLTVGVADLGVRDEVQRRLARLRIPREAVRIARRPPSAEVSSLQEVHRPLVGGLQLNMSGGGFCTLGVVAWNPRLSQWGLITNTHCTDTRGSLEGTRFFQHTRSGTLFQNRAGTDVNEIASEADDPSYFTGGDCPVNRRCRYSDSAFAAFTTFPNPQPSFQRGFIAFAAGGDPRWQGTTLDIGNEESSPIVGRVVGKVGRTSGLSISKVTDTCLTANSFIRAGDALQDTGTTLICQAKANYTSQGGDSGAPVFSRPGGGVWHLAGLNYRGDAMFSPISQIQRSDELGWLFFCTSRC